MKVKSESEVAQSCLTLRDPMDCSPPGSCLSMGFSRQEYWVGCHALLQGIFPTQGWHLYLLHLLHWQGDSLPLAALGGHLLLEAAAEDLLQAPR